jgi:hypothetical protein
VKNLIRLLVLALATLIAAPASAANASLAHKVGQVTRHARQFVDQDVMLIGYVIAREKNYVLFSDEPRGKVSMHDLPVSGAALDQMQPMTKYLIEGKFLDHGLEASNGSRYHLELTAAPRPAKP